jgi:hypothetical protein
LRQMSRQEVVRRSPIPMIRLITAAILLLLSLTAFGRTEFHTEYDGQRLTGSEICFSRAGVSGLYFARFMGDGTAVRCLPADSILDLPPGEWNYFARNGRGFVSAHPYHIEVPPGPQRFWSARVRMVPAATVDISALLASTEPSAEVVLYFANDPFTQSPSALRRIPVDETEVLVPASTQVIPIAMKGWSPFAVGSPMKLDRGARVTAKPFPAHSAVGIVPMQFHLSEKTWESGEIPPYEVRIHGTKTSTIVPSLQPGGGVENERSLIFFQLPSGENAEVSIAGRLWQTAVVHLEGTGDVVTSAPLIGQPGAQLLVDWTVDAPGAAVLHRNPSCDTKGRPPAVRLLQCAGSAATCVPLRTIERADLPGTFTEGSLAPGSYEVEFEFAPLQTVKRPVELREFEEAVVRETLGGAVVTGVITRAGTAIGPSMVTVNGITTVTNEMDGSYAVPVDVALATIPMSIRACDASFFYVYVPAETVPAGSRHDILIPDNRLEVSVVDGATGKGLPAKVSYGAIEASDPDGELFNAFIVADAAGLAVAKDVNTTFPLRICANLRGYTQSCSRPVQAEKSGVTRVEVQMTPLAQSGRLVSDTRIAAGAVYWVSSMGVVRERATVRPEDGSFSYSYTPVPGDYIVVVSQSHPLFIERPRDFARLDIAVPTGRRSISVKVAESFPRSSSLPTIMIGSSLVPRSAFSEYAAWRGISDVRAGGNYTLPDLAPDGPVSVLLGPNAGQAPIDVPPGADIFALPQYSGLIDRRSVGPDGSAVFSGR